MAKVQQPIISHSKPQQATKQSAPRGATVYVKPSVFDRVRQQILEDNTCVFIDAKTGKEIARFDNVYHQDPFNVQYLGRKKDKFKITKVRPPHEQANLLLWLMDIPLAKSHHTYIEYEDACEQARAGLMHQPGYKEYTYAGHGYEFTYFMRDSDSEPLPMAGYVDEQADRQLAVSILSNRALVRTALVYDRKFTAKLMRERFGFSDRDLARCGL